VLAQHLGDREHEVGGGDARTGSLPVSLKPTTCGMSMETGWPSMAASASMPPTPQPSTPRPLTMVVWRVGADAGVGVGLTPSTDREDDAGEVLDVDLVDDAGARGHDLEVVERRLAPAQELVALAVALVLDVDVELERVGRPKTSTCTEWSMTSSAGASGLILLRVAAEVGDGLAHGGEVDDAGHAGEVLHDHARRRELDLGVGLGVLVPAGERTDVLGGDVRAVLGAQEVLQQHLEAVLRGGRSRRTAHPPRVCRGRRSCSCWPPGLPSGRASSRDSRDLS
jgi:hypothetical protein